MAKKSTKLKEIHKMFKEHGSIIIENLETSALSELRVEISQLEDIRHESYVRHILCDIVMIVLIAVLADADEWIEIELFAVSKKEWLEKFLELPNGIPSHDTIQRVFSKLDSTHLHNTCINFIISKINELYELSNKLSIEDIELEKDIRAIDGKCSIGTHRNKANKSKEEKAIHSLNMYSDDLGLCISQVFVDVKSNEIPASKDILDIVDVENCIITCDALNTQKDIVEKIIKKGGNYVCALKGNQHNFFKDVKDYFIDDIKKDLEKNNKYLEYKSKENSNIVTRKHYLENNIDWLFNKEKWYGISTVGLVQKIIEKPDNTIVEENRYYICSIDNIEEFARCSRGHWGVENKLHWQLDYTFRDDKNTTVEKTSAKNMQIIKKIALALLNLVKPQYKISLKNIRKKLSWDFEKQITNMFKLIKVEDIKKLLLI